MGYTTDFQGRFECHPPLDQDQVNYLQAFNNTRRMARNPDLLDQDPLREAVGLPAGRFGDFYVAGTGSFGQGDEPNILGHNTPPGHKIVRNDLVVSVGYGSRRDPRIQPGLWCQWTATDDGTAIVWDGGEKFYNYIEWLQYLQAQILSRWGVKLSGSVQWFGEDMNDFGVILAQEGTIRATAHDRRK